MAGQKRAAEGGKGVLWVTIRKVCAIERLLAQKRQAFENRTERVVQTESFLVCRIGWRLRIAKKGL